MLKCQLLFNGVFTFEMHPNTNVDFDEILEIGLIDDFGKIKIVLSSNEDVTVLIVNAKEVNLIKNW
ncbi:hypothetical protein ACFVR1_16235 [Psychrobacillus sp. NPDC058041]|uniref:hypothetical protein n=1 Tax=Psychrobacillus sp. NPDC058041 TaxID=3346310 RepID=UPI0036D8533D